MFCTPGPRIARITMISTRKGKAMATSMMRISTASNQPVPRRGEGGRAGPVRRPGLLRQRADHLAHPAPGLVVRRADRRGVLGTVLRLPRPGTDRRGARRATTARAPWHGLAAAVPRPLDGPDERRGAARRRGPPAGPPAAARPAGQGGLRRGGPGGAAGPEPRRPARGLPADGVTAGRGAARVRSL